MYSSPDILIPGILVHMGMARIYFVPDPVKGLPTCIKNRHEIQPEETLAPEAMMA
ncbi:MAG: hypothetical protein LBD72_03625 [Puniceicoccales bacterium]|jgi:hypothetical protein|nr:hypothetical protein [Puniceicoccales bacterium]